MYEFYYHKKDDHTDGAILFGYSEIDALRRNPWFNREDYILDMVNYAD